MLKRFNILKNKVTIFKVEQKMMYEAAYRHDESKSIYKNRKSVRVVENVLTTLRCISFPNIMFYSTSVKLAT